MIYQGAVLVSFIFFGAFLCLFVDEWAKRHR